MYKAGLVKFDCKQHPSGNHKMSQDATKCWHSSGHQWNAQSWRGMHFCRPQGHEIHLDLKISRGANEVDVCGGCRMPFLGPPDGEGAISIEGHVWSWNCFGPMTARSILCLEKLKDLRIRHINFFTMIYIPCLNSWLITNNTHRTWSNHNFSATNLALRKGMEGFTKTNLP